MVSRIAAALPRARGVLLAGRAHHRARRLDQALERTRPALQMDQDRRPDHRPHLPLLLSHLRTGTLGRGGGARTSIVLGHKRRGPRLCPYLVPGAGIALHTRKNDPGEMTYGRTK